MADDQIADSSTAPLDSLPSVTAADQAVTSRDQSAYAAARQAERMGTPLDAKPAGSSPAPPEDPAASTDASSEPVSETGARKTAEDRKKELAAEVQTFLDKRAALGEEIRREEARLQALRQPPTPDAKPAAPSTATVDPTDPEPDPDNAEKYPDGQYDRQFIRDQAAWTTRQVLRAQRDTEAKEAEREQQDRAVAERLVKFAERIDAEGGDTFMEGISDEVKKLENFAECERLGKKPTGYNAIAELLLESEAAPTLMRHFTDHPEDLHRIAKLMPKPLLIEMGRLEAKLEAPARTPTKTTSDAPPPPARLGSRPGGPADEEAAAIQAKDQTAYSALRLRQRMAALTR